MEKNKYSCISERYSKVLELLDKVSSDVFFIQERIGKNGKKFNAYKIRTMDKGADLNIPDNVKKGDKFKNDNRIIENRKWLRKTGIDEIPQILNILKGEMNFFGARPLSLSIYDNLKELEKEQRLKFKPGIFGGYAFYEKGKRGEERTLREDQNVYLRLRYINTKKGKIKMFLFNIYVLIENIKFVLKGKNR